MRRIQQLPTLCIGTGLLMLVVAQFWPPLPVVSAVALIGLGASSYTAGHWRTHILPVALHLMLYVGLTALFVGARWHATSVGLADWHLVDALDFYIAAGLVAVTVSSTVASLQVTEA